MSQSKKVILKNRLKELQKNLLNKKAEAFDIYLKNNLVAEEEVKKDIINIELEIENINIELTELENEDVKLLIKKFNSLHLDLKDISSCSPIIKSLSNKNYSNKESKEAINKIIEFINSL